MNDIRIENVSRRGFLKAGGALSAGLVLGVHVPASAQGAAAKAGTAFAPNAFVRIGTDNTVTVVSKHLEMGQGTYTGLATIVAEELDADWGQVQVEGAPADACALQQPALGACAGHRRQHRDRQLLRAAAQGRRDRARDAGRRGRAALERPGRVAARSRGAWWRTRAATARRRSASSPRRPPRRPCRRR